MTRALDRRGAPEGAFIGALLGLAIGDALGMPVTGLTPAEIRATHGRLDRYLPGNSPAGEPIAAGEVTDETEFALAIVEAITTNRGVLDDPTRDLIGARLVRLIHGDSTAWIGADTLATLARAEDSLEFLVPLADDGPATGDVAARGVPIGLLHAVGRLDEAALQRDAEVVTRLTHGSPAAIAATVAVSYGVCLAARGEVPLGELPGRVAAFLQVGALATALVGTQELLDGGMAPPDVLARIGSDPETTTSVPAAFVAAAMSDFQEAVLLVVNAGGKADTVGALTGAIAGAAGRDVAIPQPLIDGLGARIYISLAAPWYYKAALQRAGLLIDLRPASGDQPPRPTMPPRQ